MVSASSSFLRFILSLSASASRRAIWIFCCTDSALASAMTTVADRQRLQWLVASPGVSWEVCGSGAVGRGAAIRSLEGQRWAVAPCRCVGTASADRERGQLGAECAERGCPLG